MMLYLLTLLKEPRPSLKSRLDFRWHWVEALPLLFLLATPAAMAWMPIRYTYENSVLENFQLVVLFITGVLAACSKTDKKFFRFIVWVCSILILREISCGRIYFFPVEGEENMFYSWCCIPYGYLANPIFTAYILASVVYFIATRSYVVALRYLFRAKLAVWTWALLLLGLVFGSVSEWLKADVPEEMTETVFYLAFAALIYLHSRHADYIASGK